MLHSLFFTHPIMLRAFILLRGRGGVNGFVFQLLRNRYIREKTTFAALPVVQTREKLEEIYNGN